MKLNINKHESPPQMPDINSLRAESSSSGRAYQMLVKYLSAENKAELDRCTERLLHTLPNPSSLQENIILVLYGGGKDSTWLTAATRYIQLSIASRYGETPKLRIVTNRHAGMPRAVMENIDRTYTALECYDDKNVELLLIDGNEINPFVVDTPLPDKVRQQNRLDILMTGHKTRGIYRAMFCNACNLSMVNAMALALSYGQGADLMVTGDSPREQKDYLKWTLRTARELNLESSRESEKGLRGILSKIRDIGAHYFKEIYAEDQPLEMERRICLDGLKREPIFFSIFEDACYNAGSHWELLNSGLGFVFDEIAFAFSESDCGNPGLMCHLQGLKKERLDHLGYEEGIREYVKFAISLMEKKNFPPLLIEIMRERYHNKAAIRHMRTKMNLYAQEAFDLGETQLTCLVFAPFTEGGKFLHEYLVQEHPQLLAYKTQIHELLSNSDSPSELLWLERELTAISGLSVNHLRHLYGNRIVGNGSISAASPIEIVLKRDPHKELISSRRANGESVTELITGR